MRRAREQLASREAREGERSSGPSRYLQNLATSQVLRARLLTHRLACDSSAPDRSGCRSGVSTMWCEYFSIWTGQHGASAERARSWDHQRPVTSDERRETSDERRVTSHESRILELPNASKIRTRPSHRSQRPRSDLLRGPYSARVCSADRTPQSPPRSPRPPRAPCLAQHIAPSLSWTHLGQPTPHIAPHEILDSLHLGLDEHELEVFFL
jgi:hypothetical protein